MRGWPQKQRDELWEEMRARLIAETSAWLADALRHPEQAIRIPVVLAGAAEFPPSLARAFWQPLLVE